MLYRQYFQYCVFLPIFVPTVFDCAIYRNVVQTVFYCAIYHSVVLAAFHFVVLHSGVLSVCAIAKRFSVLVYHMIVSVQWRSC